MCGFIGYLNNNKLNDKVISNALNLIAHRGPDDKKIVKDNNTSLSLAFCRLSIQDVSTKAMQPLYDDSENIIILFNGEIYNFLKLREELINLQHSFKTKSDTEVLLLGYKEWGIQNLLKKIKGMFSFVIIDKRINKVYLVRDHFGIKPLYYSIVNRLIFSSEIKPITYLSSSMEWDNEAAISSLFTGMAQIGKTPYRNVHEVKPGNFLIYDLKTTSLEIFQYFTPRELVNENEYNSINKMSNSEVTEHFNTLLTKSVNDHLVSDVEVGSCFSAGLDSSLISSIANRNNNLKDFKLFCFLSKQDESIIKKNASKFKNKFNNKLIYINEGNESNVISKIVENLYYTEMPNKIEGSALSQLCNYAYKNGNKVLLTGDAADEILGGYHFHKQFLNRSLSSKGSFNFIIKLLNIMQPINLFELSNTNPTATDYFSQPSHLDLFELQYNFLVNRDGRLKTWKKNLEAYNFIQNQSDKNTQSFILDSIYYKLSKYLHRSDRYGMRNSVELRIPYLDIDFVKACLNLNLQHKIKLSFFNRKVQDKLILRKLSLYNEVPKSIINRKKIGTNMNYKNELNKICMSIDFNHCEEILKINKNEIKYNLTNSDGPNMEMFQYNFLSHEILGLLFIENESREKVIEKFKK